MAIDARIEGVTVVAPTHCLTCNGSGKDPADSWDDCPTCHGATRDKPQVRLQLVPREKGGVAGQSVLTIVNPPTLNPGILACMVGAEIWGGNGEIMMGDTLWAKRIGYTQIELVKDHKAIDLIRSEEGNSVTILCDDPEAETKDRQTAVEVCGDFTEWETVRFYAETWPEALAKAAYASRLFNQHRESEDE